MDDDDLPPPASKVRRPQKRDHTDIQSFAWLIANNMTGTEAARQAALREHLDDPMPDAHLAAQRATKLMKRRDVLDLIATMKQRVADDIAAKYSVTRETVLKDLIDVKNRCMQAEPVVDKDGEPTGEYKFNAEGAINALKLIGQDLGMFVKRVEHRHTLSNLTDEQLLERARNAAIQLTAIEAAVDDSGAGGADPATRGDRGGDPPSIN